MLADFVESYYLKKVDPSLLLVVMQRHFLV